MKIIFEYNEDRKYGIKSVVEIYEASYNCSNNRFWVETANEETLSFDMSMSDYKRIIEELYENDRVDITRYHLDDE